MRVPSLFDIEMQTNRFTFLFLLWLSFDLFDYKAENSTIEVDRIHCWLTLLPIRVVLRLNDTIIWKMSRVCWVSLFITFLGTLQLQKHATAFSSASNTFLIQATPIVLVKTGFCFSFSPSPIRFYQRWEGRFCSVRLTLLKIQWDGFVQNGCRFYYKIKWNTKQKDAMVCKCLKSTK